MEKANKMQVVTISRATHELGTTKNLTRSPVSVPSERDEENTSDKQVPPPSEKGLLTDICDTPISRRKCRPLQLFKTEEIRFGKTAYPLFAEKIDLSIDSDSSEKNIYNYSDMNKEDNINMLTSTIFQAMRLMIMKNKMLSLKLILVIPNVKLFT